MRTALVILLLLSAMCCPALAQDEDRFREVEAGVEDLGQGAVSNLLRPVDLRVPTEFGRVYEVVGSGKFARRAGAITAVFDRSAYAGDGTPLVPAGTVFYIGSLPVDLDGPGLLNAGARWASSSPAARVETLVSAPPAEPERVAQQIDLRVGSGEPAPPLVRDADGGIWTSEPYRQRRLGELLRGAAARVRSWDGGAGAPGERGTK